MQMGQKGFDLIKQFEGFKANAYKCPANVWTIGYGTTKGVKEGQHITVATANTFLLNDVAQFVKDINTLVKVPLTQNQFDALVCFVYNVGTGNFRSSTLLKMINSRNFAGAAAQFVRWNKAKGVTLNGLTRRREAEAALFLTK